ncbi:MAG: TonB-dependent receptor [Bacteroides sp.]|nr:TonB-dependent receptor [Bacteroides sp.]
MKRLLATFITCGTLFGTVVAQNICGRVTDEQNQPLPYANVILQTEDSTYLAGTTTGSDGRFELVKPEMSRLISVSFVGYATVIRKIDGTDLGTIRLLPDAQLLGEVVVKGYLPKTQIKGDAMVTAVSGSVLEKAGTAENLLDKIPNVTAQNGVVNVFGRGTPEIYINGRKMRDVQELEQLSSDEIKSVEVVSNPGARYGGAVKAVIRIITKKVAGEGFGINNLTMARHQRDYGMTFVEQLNFNYRKKGFDLAGMVYGNSVRAGNDQLFSIDTYLDKHWKQYLDLTSQKHRSKNLSTMLSLNYQFNEKHMMGARYSFKRTPESDWQIVQLAKTHCNNLLHESLRSLITAARPESYHSGNFYYNGSIKNWKIDFNADYFRNNSKDGQESREKITGGESGNTDRIVTTKDSKRNELYAAKLILSHPIAKGMLSFGGEYSHNNRNTTYFNDEGILENDRSQIKEGATSAFVEYARSFNKLQVQAGVRFEHVGFDYYGGGEYMAAQSKKYNNLFSSLSVGFPIKNVRLRLGYASDINRPSYHNLRSNTTYVNRYMYEQGNPFLMPSITHNVTLVGVYKWMNLYVGYSHVVDDITNQTVAFSEEDPSIGLLTLLNAPEYDKLALSLNLTPTIGLWRPQFNASLQKQWYQTETPQGKESFGKPIGIIALRNNFKLPKEFLLDVNGSWISKGHTTNVYMSRNKFEMSVSLYKSFLKDALSIQLNANNLLESKQEMLVYSGIRVMQNEVMAHRQLSLTLRYKLNSTKSKYKGTGAGATQKNRM